MAHVGQHVAFATATKLGIFRVSCPIFDEFLSECFFSLWLSSCAFATDESCVGLQRKLQT